jgi:hypothetical protein
LLRMDRLLLGVLGVGRARRLGSHDLRANIGDRVISGMLRHLNCILNSASEDVVLSISSFLKLVGSQ